MAINVSGTLYSDEGVTPITAGVTLNISVNGAASAGTAVTSLVDGTFTFLAITAASGAVLTVYVQDAINTQKAVTVTRSTGSNMTGVDLYQNDLIGRSDGGVLSAANWNTSDANGATGVSTIYSSSSTVLTIASGKNFYVPSGQSVTTPPATLTCPGNMTVKGTFSTGATAVTVSGNLSITGTYNAIVTGTAVAGNLTNSGTLTVTTGAGITVTGNWSNSGTFTSATGTVTLNGTGSGGTIASGGQSFNNLVISGSGGTYTLQDALAVKAHLDVTAGTLDVSSSNYGVSLTGSSPRILLSGTGAFTARSGTVTHSTTTSSMTITSNGSSFYNLTSTVNASMTMQDAMVITNGLTLTLGTLILNGFNLTTTGATISNGGTIQLNGSETLTGFTNDATHGTVTYVGTGSTTYASLAAGSTYNHLTFNGSGRKWQPAADVTVNGNLTVTAGTLDMSNANKNVGVAGDWSNSGTFTAGTGTVTLNGTGGSTQTISGSTTFYNLTATAAAARTLTFTDGTTQTVSNALILQGASGQLLILQGSSTGGWTISVPSTQTIDHVSVSYSTATTNTAVADNTSTDGGHNTNWTFGTSAVNYTQSLSGALTETGSSLVSAVTNHLSDSLTGTGMTVRATSAFRVGSITETGTFVKACSQPRASSLEGSGGLVNAASKGLTGSQTLTGSGILRAVGMGLTGVLTSSGSLVKSITARLTAALTMLGTLAKSVAIRLTGLLTYSGAFTRAKHIDGLQVGAEVFEVKDRPTLVHAIDRAGDFDVADRAGNFRVREDD